MFSVVLLYALLAGAFTIAKKCLFYVKPFFLIGFRMTLAGTILLGYQYFFGKDKLNIKKEDIWLFVQAIFFHVYLVFVPEFWALQYLTSSKTNLIYSATPFITAFLAYILLSEKLGAKKFLGMIVGLLGLLPIFLTQTDIREASMELYKISLPEIVLFFATASAAYAWFVIKKLTSKGYSFSIINGVAMFFGGLLAFATSFLLEGFFTPKIFDFWPFLFWTLALIGLSNIVVYKLYTHLLHKYSVTFVSSAGYLCPVFGVFYGWLFLSEKITWHYFASMAAIALGLYIFYKQEKK